MYEALNGDAAPAKITRDSHLLEHVRKQVEAREETRNVVVPKGADPRFVAHMQKMLTIHAAKGADYGTSLDVFANVRSAQEFGLKPWLGALLRLNDKVARLKTFCVKGSLENEGVEDTLLDLANYALIALILFQEGKQS